MFSAIGTRYPEVDRCDVLEMSLPTDTLLAVYRAGLTLQDVLDGKVLGLDPDEVIATAMEETGSYDGHGHRSRGLNP